MGRAALFAKCSHATRNGAELATRSEIWPPEIGVKREKEEASN